jgi:hypothetical protein
MLACGPLVAVACGARTPIDLGAGEASALEAGSVDASDLDATSEPPIADASSEGADTCLSWQGLQQDVARGRAAEADAGVAGQDVYGGWTFGPPAADTFAQFFRQIAVVNGVCAQVSTCTYDPVASSSALRALIGPDGLSYIWAEAPDGSEIVLAREDRNTGTYALILQYNECTLGAGR